MRSQKDKLTTKFKAKNRICDGAFKRIFKIKALIFKELIVLLKDPKSRFALMMPPLIQLALFASVATLDVFNIKMAVLNQDGGAYSKEIILDAVAAKEYFTQIVEVQNYQQIQSLIDKQKVIGAIVFAPDFSKKIAAGKTAEVQILFDGRRLNSASIVSGYLQQIMALSQIRFYKKFLGSSFFGDAVDKDIHEETKNKLTTKFEAKVRIYDGAIMQNSVADKVQFKSRNITQNAVLSQVVSRNWFNPNLNYKWFIIPSLLALILSTSILSVSALSIAREREIGTFDQLIVSPLSPLEIVLGKIGANLAIGLVQGVIIFSIIAAIIPFNGNLFFMLIGILLYLISMVSIGLFISALSNNQQQATLGSFFFLIPVILTSGFSSPFANMPIWLQQISEAVNPIHHFVAVLQLVFAKGASFELLGKNFGALFAMSGATLFLATWFFKRRVL